MERIYRCVCMWGGRKSNQNRIQNVRKEITQNTGCFRKCVHILLKIFKSKGSIMLLLLLLIFIKLNFELNNIEYKLQSSQITNESNFVFFQIINKRKKCQFSTENNQQQQSH